MVKTGLRTLDTMVLLTALGLRTAVVLVLAILLRLLLSRDGNVLPTLVTDPLLGHPCKAKPALLLVRLGLG